MRFVLRPVDDYYKFRFGRPFYCSTWVRPLTEMSAIQNNIKGPNWDDTFDGTKNFLSQQDIAADCFAKIQRF